jgi:Flp pilus assembly protein TadG
MAHFCFLSSLRRFLRDRSGNIAIFFSLALVPLIGFIGLGVDYGRALNARNKLQAATDAAAVGSLAPTSPAVKAAATMGDGTVTVGQTDALNIFNANIAGTKDYTLQTVTATVTKASGQLTSKVDYTANVPTAFMRVLGVQTVAIGGTSTATVDRAPNIDFYFLLDNSPSMGIAATPDEYKRLKQLTTGSADGNCGFACHITARPLPTGDNGLPTLLDHYEIARLNNVPLRIDNVRSAAKRAIDLAAKSPTQFRVGVFDFGAASPPVLRETYPLGNNFTIAAATVALTPLMSVYWWGAPNDDSDTPHNQLLTEIARKIGKSGSGAPGDPQKILFLISDGVTDERMDPVKCVAIGGKVVNDNGRCNAPVDPALCRNLDKPGNGVQVAVLYTTYFPLPDDGHWADYIKPMSNKIPENMKACASSPDLFKEVALGGDLSAALEALFNKATAQALRLAR